MLGNIVFWCGYCKSQEHDLFFRADVNNLQIAVVLEATQLPERDVPEYIEADHSKMAAKFIRTPNLGDVPYPVIMEPNLVIEYYAQN